KHCACDRNVLSSEYLLFSFGKSGTHETGRQRAAAVMGRAFALHGLKIPASAGLFFGVNHAV
ncbi:MAG: hypothetical protein IIY54_03455, partial [Ruminococcus sp.]|nr:hypothetical protein [Ruminococcus sp.]